MKYAATVQTKPLGNRETLGDILAMISPGRAPDQASLDKAIQFALQYEDEVRIRAEQIKVHQFQFVSGPSNLEAKMRFIMDELIRIRDGWLKDHGPGIVDFGA